jgi:hypothetical protein
MIADTFFKEIADSVIPAARPFGGSMRRPTMRLLASGKLRMWASARGNSHCTGALLMRDGRQVTRAIAARWFA